MASLLSSGAEISAATSDAQPLQSLVIAPTVCRVSSVLDRNKTLYGASNMLSSDANTCWNSAQGSPQQVLLQFQRAVHLRRVDIMFQGGFVGQDVEIRVRRPTAPSEWVLLTDVDIDPVDGNDLQSFPCVADDVEAMQISFTRSTDFYGRVIIYRLDVLGVEATV